MGKTKGRENPRSSSPGHNSRIRNRPHVPRDVWWDVFTFLPASSLVRFRSVCKAWRTVIDDPIFGRAHLEKHQISSSNTILIRTSTRTNNILIGTSTRTSSTALPFAPYYSVDLDALIPRDGLQTIPATPARPDIRGLEVATCHGLMFEDLEIWNPLFADRLKLPPGDGFTLPGPYEVVRGLGYDHATDDYKAVLIDCGRRFRPRQLAFSTFVYSLRSDSWRRIGDCPCGPRGLVHDRPGLFVSGSLHWRSFDDDDDEIIALDLETEKYRKLQMPPFGETPVEVTERGRQLGVLGGCLAVTGFCKDGFCSFKIDASVLERGGSWIKLFSFWHFFSDGRNCSSMRPVGYIMKNKRHILMEDYGEFYLVDAERENLKRVSFRELECYRAQPLQESLFRPKDFCGVVSGQQRKKMSSRDQKKSKTKRRMMEKYNTDLCFCVSDF